MKSNHNVKKIKTTACFIITTMSLTLLPIVESIAGCGIHERRTNAIANFMYLNKTDMPLAFGFNLTDKESTNDILVGGSGRIVETLCMGVLDEQCFARWKDDQKIKCEYRGHWPLSVFKATKDNVGSQLIGHYQIEISCKKSPDKIWCESELTNRISNASQVDPNYKVYTKTEDKAGGSMTIVVIEKK